MISRNKFVIFPRMSSTSHFTVFIYIFVIICLNNLCLSSEDCKHITDCKCIFNNGSIIDLSSFAKSSDNKPVWENVKSFAPNDTYEYFYNPCHKFSLDNGDCKNVEVCRKNDKGEHFNIGSQGYPQFNNQNHSLSFVYRISTTESSTNTIVRLLCSPKTEIPKLEVLGKSGNSYEMKLTSRCACPDLCSERHLSGGSVLVIIFMIFVSLYLILGIIHSSLTRGAHGWELIPHYEFWMDFPLLVRDGCVFVMSGCKPETAYERI